MPDSSESRERADPAKEAGLGQMSENKSGPVNKPEKQEQDRAQNELHRERTADDTMDQDEAVDPTDPAAHGGHRGDDEDEAIGRRPAPDERRGPEEGGH